MNFIKKKTIRLSISWLLIFSLLSTSILPTFSSLSTNVQAQEVNGYVYQETDFTVRDNSAEIKDIENLLATEKPSWQSPSFTKKSLEYQALTQPELVTEYPEYNLSSGTGGTYLEVTGSSVEVFSPKGVKAQSVTMNWQDSLNAWISSREAPKYEAKAPVPNGYTTSVYVKDKVTGKEYKIRGNQENNNGKNSFTWNGTDINGIALPDGVYEWYIKAAPQTVVFVKTETVADVDEDGNKVFIDIEKDVTETAPGYSPEYSFITLDQTQPEILAIHDLGNGKIGIETRDEVSGVKIVNAVNKQTFNDHPLHVIAPISVTQNDLLTITVQDWAGNEVTETLPTHPAMTHTGYQSFYPNVSETIAGENVGINLYSGNGIVSFEGFTQPGIGLDVSTDITYNHQNRQKGLLGYGFTFDFEHKITPWTNGDATYISGDGTKYLFKKNSSGYTTYAGGQEQYYPQLTKTETQIFLTWEDLSTYTFSKDGRILEQKDRYGNKNTFTYEEIDRYHNSKEYRLDYITGSTNKKIGLIYNTETGKLDKIQGPGREEGLTREVSFEYQDNKLIYKDVMNASTTIAFDSMKRVESITKPNNVTTDWSYGSKNRLERVSMTRSQDNVEEYINVYYQDKQAIITNPISEYTLTWDMQGRPDSKKESVEVAGFNNTTKIETAYTYYTYDRNNLVKTVDPMGIITESAYDDRDRLKATKSPSGSVMNYQYNDKNDLVLETGPYGYKIEYQYNYSDNKISNAKTIKHVQDPYGRTAPYQATSQIYYQANGLIDYEIDGNNNNINYSYDSNGFLTNNGFDTTYTNDLVGNVKTKTAYAGTADANTTTFEYNDRNQQVKVIYPELIQVNENGSRYSQRLIQEDNYNQLSGLLESTEQYDQFNPSKKMSAEYLYDDGNNNIRVTTDNIVTKSIVDGVGNTTKTITYPLDAPNEQLVKEYIVNQQIKIERKSHNKIVTKEKNNVQNCKCFKKEHLEFCTLSQ